MEVLYAILMLSLVILGILFLLLLFRNNRDPKGKTDFKKVFHGLFPKPVPKPVPVNAKNEYQLVYNCPDSVNETMREPALKVKVTHVRDQSVCNICYIHDDEFLSREGVTIGRENCDYNMRSKLIDRKGSFLLKRVGDDFMIISARDSVNGVKKAYGGERVKCVDFVNGKATCYVGPIRFEFTVPTYDYEEESTADAGNGNKSRFYSEETIKEALN